MITLRPSILPTFADCERRAIAQLFPKLLAEANFKVRQLDRSIGAVIGTGVHRGVEMMLRAKIDTGTVGSLSDSLDAAVDQAREERKLGAFFDDATPSADDIPRQMSKMLASYRTYVASVINPAYVEMRLEAEFADGFIVSGQTDVLCQETNSDIRDTKTGKVVRSYLVQLGAYDLIQTAHGYTVGSLYADWVPRVRVTKDQPRPMTQSYDRDVARNAAWATMTRAVEVINDFQARTQSGSAPPEHAALANPSSMLCAEKWCPAWGTSFCKEWQPKKSND